MASQADRGRDPERDRGRGPGQDPDRESPGGPVPVRDLMKTMTPEPEAAGEPRWEGEEQGFERDGVEWVVRSAGAGSYGTGTLGTSRLVAVHFFRADDPDVPVREALVPAGVFPHLHAQELRELYDRATPIELDR